MSAVFCPLSRAEKSAWQSAAGVLTAAMRGGYNIEMNSMPSAILGRDLPIKFEEWVWQKGGFRLFISHSHKDSQLAGNLKSKISPYGIDAFAAHENIEPTAEWERFIRGALLSMDAFLVLVSEDAKKSHWVNQEVGFACSREIPVISVRVSVDPCGFIGKFQAIRNSLPDLPIKIVENLINQRSERLAMLDAYIQALPRCEDWNQGIVLAKVLPAISRISPSQICSLIRIYCKHGELWGSWGFNGKRHWEGHGKGLNFHLKRLTGHDYNLPGGREMCQYQMDEYFQNLCRKSNP